ncbi:MAG: S8 family serine peptidase [Pyrinomonadaceae bacterium]|nr:S8 family serine peptidase [Pyrinomonadaceae bacterium]
MSSTVSSEMFDALTDMKLDDEWKSSTGKGVSVVIIDSGVDKFHSDLKGKIKNTFAAVRDGNRTVFEETDAGDSAGHGTACAGIISKIAPEADLSSIKVLGAGGLGDGHAFLAGLEFAIKQGYKIINLSLGTTKPQFVVPLNDLINRAYQAGCIIVAAGNNLPQPSYPSVFSSSLIAVSKSSETNYFDFGFNFGETIELTAPGVNVRTTWLNDGYRTLTGNSFACPHIVGVITLLLESFPDLTPFQVKSALYSIARRNQERKS